MRSRSLHFFIKRRVLAATVAGLTLLACGGDESATTSHGATSGSTGGVGGAGGAAGAAGGGGVGGSGGTPEYVPTPADIEFSAVNPLPAGEQILFNDWNPLPNVVYSMTLDGAAPVPIFKAFRVWSMGVSHAVDRIAFACGDVLQQVHYGVSIGDAIQHTWVYDVATEQASVVAYGNINDECHTFAPNDARLYVCRRYDFTNDTNKGYRIGRIDLASKAFEFLTPDVASELDLDPQPTSDESALYFEAVLIEGTKQSPEIRSLPLPPGTATTILANAAEPALSPDGTRYTYSDWSDMGSLYVVPLAGGTPVKLVDHHVSGVRWSPDQTRVAFLDFDDTANCSEIETAKVDGTDLGSPVRVRDCGMTGEFITEIAWIVH